MKIGIDLRTLEGGSAHRGIGRYATCLIQALSRIDHDNHYTLFLSNPNAKKPRLQLDGGFSYEFSYNKKPGLRGVRYIRAAFVMERPLSIDHYNLDAFLQLDPTLRVNASHTPIVSILHDLIPFIYKDTYQAVHLGGHGIWHYLGYARSKLYWHLIEQAQRNYRHSARIISISEHSKNDLLNLEPRVQKDRIEVIPLAAETLPTEPLSTKDVPLITHPFLLFVGGVDPRKGLISLVDSMEAVWNTHPDLHLLLIGKEINDMEVPEARRLQKSIAALSRSQQIIIPGYIPDTTLAHLYAHAEAFVFPSRYEGFGLPVLEAMQAGCPVVAYDNSSIPEVAGDAAMLVKDGESMVPALKQVLEDKHLRERLVAKGKTRAQLFTWERTAEATLRVVREVAQ